MCLLAQEQREELQLMAFVLHSVNETSLKDALKLTSDDVADLRALLRDDHHGICLIIRLLQRDRATQTQRRTARKCHTHTVDTVLHNRVSVKRGIADILNELQVMLSNPQL